MEKQTSHPFSLAKKLGFILRDDYSFTIYTYLFNKYLFAYFYTCITLFYITNITRNAAFNTSNTGMVLM